MSDRTGDTKLSALIDSSNSFNIIISLVAKLLGWAIKPNSTPVAVKLANGAVVHSLGAINALLSSSV